MPSPPAVQKIRMEPQIQQMSGYGARGTLRCWPVNCNGVRPPFEIEGRTALNDLLDGLILQPFKGELIAWLLVYQEESLQRDPFLRGAHSRVIAQLPECGNYRFFCSFFGEMLIAFLIFQAIVLTCVFLIARMTTFQIVTVLALAFLMLLIFIIRTWMN